MNEPETIREMLENTKTIAVVGLTDKPGRASKNVSSYMKAHGYKIIPVNPRREDVLGEKAYASVAEIPEHVDLVNVFRRADAIPAVLDDVLKKDGVKYLWIQLGIVNQEAAERAEQAGLKVVMDHCIYIEHARRS